MIEAGKSKVLRASGTWIVRTSTELWEEVHVSGSERVLLSKGTCKIRKMTCQRDRRPSPDATMVCASTYDGNLRLRLQGCVGKGLGQAHCEAPMIEGL